MNIIEIEGVTKRFIPRSGDVVHALDSVDLSVRENEFLTLLGPSGCGKTTLLRTIAGLEKADSGTVTVEGAVVTGPGPERAMVFQSFALLPWMSVIDNVSFGLRMRGVAKSEREDRAMTIIEKIGLKGFERKQPHELSGGMQQRVGLARALAVKPRVLLMDEPFSAVDEQTRRLLQEQLIQIWEQDRTTVVFVTHSIDEAILLGDRIVLMSPRPGRISEIKEVAIERPRSQLLDHVESNPEWGRLKHHMWSLLRGLQPEEVETR
jgi:NitT/TauT family transport system ATP-binding protein